MFACISRLSFTDGGEDEIMVLHKGTKEECEGIADLIPAVAYSGSRPVREARIQIVTIVSNAP